MIKFKSLIDLLIALPNEQDCINYLEKYRWNGKAISPFDPTSKVYKCKNNRYKCKNTNKYFNVKIGTIFENSKISLQKWFWVLFDFSSKKKGISSHQLTRELDITQKTAWFMLNRIRYTFDQPSFIKEMLKGVVEIDEMFIGGKNKNRHWNKKIPKSQGRSCKDKIPVWGAIERGGFLIAEAVPNNQQSTLVPIVRDNIKESSDVYSDELPAYEILGKWYNHEIVNHKAKQYVNGKVSTNTIESAWAPFKRSVYGIYHWISKKHAQRYVDEITFRFNTRKYEEKDRFDLVLSSSIGKRLTYQQLIN
jgi:transposase-like protein